MLLLVLYATHLVQMVRDFCTSFVESVHWCAAELKLPPRLQADALAIVVGPNDVLILHDRLPAKPAAEVLKEKFDCFILQALVTVEIVPQFLMLRPNPAQ